MLVLVLQACSVGEELGPSTTPTSLPLVTASSTTEVGSSGTTGSPGTTGGQTDAGSGDASSGGVTTSASASASASAGDTEQPAVCGDGEVEGDEPCDDGNDVETDDCLSGCVAAVCGDLVVQALV